MAGLGALGYATPWLCLSSRQATYHGVFGSRSPFRTTSEQMKFSIVVPNLNGGIWLEQSLLIQNYGDLEIIVIDGGSLDDSLAIIRNYESSLTYWTSEPDDGQASAINKGFSHATGEIVNWLCSDDRLVPGALSRVDRQFTEAPEIDVVCGSCLREWPNGAEAGRIVPTAQKVRLLPASIGIPQPSCFYRRELLDRTPPLDETFNYAMDVELWSYFHSKGAKWCCIKDDLSIYNVGSDTKSSMGGFVIFLERERIYRRYCQEALPLVFWYKHFQVPLIRLQKGKHGIYSNMGRRMNRLISKFLALFYGPEKVAALRWGHFVKP